VGRRDRGKLRAWLTDWQGTLTRQPEIARQILRKLIVGRLVLTPGAEARTYTLQGRDLWAFARGGA
jgi:hypothetical protein